MNVNFTKIITMVKNEIHHLFSIIINDTFVI